MRCVKPEGPLMRVRRHPRRPGLLCLALLVGLACAASVSAQAAGAPPPPRPSDEPGLLTVERERQLREFLEAVGRRGIPQPATLQDEPPGAGRPVAVRLGFSNRAQITDFSQWPTAYAGQLLIGPQSVHAPFAMELWKGREGEPIGVNGESGWGTPNRPSGGFTLLTVEGQRLRLSPGPPYAASTYIVMWRRNGWACASVMQRWSAAEARPAVGERVKAEALTHARLLDQALSGSTQDLRAMVRGYLRHLAVSPATLPGVKRNPACEPDAPDAGQACGVQVVRWVGEGLSRIGDPDPGAGTEEQREAILKAAAEHPAELAAILYGFLSDPELSQSGKELDPTAPVGVPFVGPGLMHWHRAHLGVYEILMMRNKRTGRRADVRINLEEYDRRRPRTTPSEDDYDRLLRYARACDRWGLLDARRWDDTLKLSGKMGLFILDMICAGFNAGDVAKILDKGLQKRFAEAFFKPENLPGAVPISFGSITSFAGFMDKALGGKLKGEQQASSEALKLLIKGIFTANSSLKGPPTDNSLAPGGLSKVQFNPLGIDWVMKRTLSGTLLLSDDVIPRLKQGGPLPSPSQDLIDAMVEAPHQKAWLDRADLAARLFAEETMRQFVAFAELEAALQEPEVRLQYDPKAEPTSFKGPRDAARRLLNEMIPQMVSLYYYAGHNQPPDLPIPNLDQDWKKATGQKSAVIPPVITNPGGPAGGGGGVKPGPGVASRPLPTNDALINRALKGVQDDPQNPKSHNFLGALLMSRGVYKEAEQAFREALRLQPDNAAFRSNLTSLLVMQERWPEAEAALLEAIKAAPQDPGLRSQLAGVYQQTGRIPQAEAAYRDAIRLEPEGHQTRAALGRLLLSQGKWAEAEAEFRRAVELQPDRATYHLDLGRALLGLRKWADAEASLRKAIELRAIDGPAHAYLAAALLGRGKKDEAVREAQEAMRLGVKEHPVFVDLGLKP